MRFHSRRPQCVEAGERFGTLRATESIVHEEEQQWFVR